jgi:hypothetical protein
MFADLVFIVGSYHHHHHHHVRGGVGGIAHANPFENQIWQKRFVMLADYLHYTLGTVMLLHVLNDCFY